MPTNGGRPPPIRRKYRTLRQDHRKAINEHTSVPPMAHRIDKQEPNKLSNIDKQSSFSYFYCPPPGVGGWIIVRSSSEAVCFAASNVEGIELQGGWEAIVALLSVLIGLAPLLSGRYVPFVSSRGSNEPSTRSDHSRQGERRAEQSRQ